MLAYIYRAALYCESCGEQIKAELGYSHEGQSDHLFDSDEYPKAALDGGGESDSPSHCDQCGLFLENALTADGYEYVHSAVMDAAKEHRLDAVMDWVLFYDLRCDECGSYPQNWDVDSFDLDNPPSWFFGQDPDRCASCGALLEE
jgi:hypothetical protein